jgi:predicted lipoprotein with Yx(FWY)xxD motif
MTTQPMNSPAQRQRRVAPRTLLRSLALVGVLTVAGSMVLPGTSGAASSPITVTTAQNKTWGKILVLGNGTTVYRLTTDPKNRSVCSGECAKVWPPVVLAAGQKTPVARGGVTGLGTIARSGGVRQVTYKGVPLYRFVGDHKSGQATGNIKDTWGKWWVVNPANPRVAPVAVHTSGGGTTPTTAPTSGAAY